METYVIRLKPGQDLKKEIMRWASTQKIKAGCVITCVGSLQEANMRFANQPEGTRLEGKYEIVSLVGTFSEEAAHLHLSISDSTGTTTGGHLMDGNLVYTTVELVLGHMPGLEFTREVDPTFGYKELVIKKRKK
ncbi:MAG: PPC domain-containing DNA-binding protein [Bacteroidota bacterium]